MDISIEGQTIKQIRKMTKKEMESEGWDNSCQTPYVLILSNGVKLYSSADYEGNASGALFGQYKNKHFAI